MPTTLRTPVRLALVLMVSILAVAGCSSGDAIGKAGSSSTTVSAGSSTKPIVVHIRDYAFVPAKSNVAAGSSVTFVNDDDVAHTGTSSDGAFDTGNIPPGKSKTVTVKATKAGPVPYICSIHQFMTGAITVTK